MTRYYVSVANGAGPEYVYDGRSKEKAREALRLILAIMSKVNGTGTVSWFLDSDSGAKHFKLGEEE